MRKAFISSVISGFEDYRQAAKKAIELMGHTPVMSENFSARNYSSETACIHEVEQSDIYILIMGEKYGFGTKEGISVTQTEFRAAIATNRPILVFIKKCEMESDQQSFLKEVEDYHGGFFRAGFQTPDELKDEIIKALRQLETMSQAVPEDVFNEKVSKALEELIDDYHFADGDPKLVLAFLPQPERIVDIVGLEDKLDDIFQSLSQTGLVKLKDGYKSLEEKHWTGLQAGELKLACFADGLIIFQTNPTKCNDSVMSGRFAPPDRLHKIATGFNKLITEKSGYLHIGLYNMENTYVAALPEGSSFSMKMFDDGQASFNRLFTPITEGAYLEWIDLCIRRFSRIFKYNETALS